MFRKLSIRVRSSLKSLLFLSAALVLPFYAKEFTITMPILYVWAAFAMSYDIILGFGGVPSFGHAAPFGLGVFVSAILLSKGYPLLLVFPAAALTGMAVNLSMGLPCYRVRGIYYAILTLAMAEMIRVLIENTARTTVAITVGAVKEFVSEQVLWFSELIMILTVVLAAYSLIEDLRSTRPPRFKALKAASFTPILILILNGAYKFTAQTSSLHHSIITESISYRELVRTLSPLNRYYISLFMMVASFIFLKKIVRSPVGSVFLSIRENPQRAEVIGYNVFRYQLLSFAVSGFIAGACGTSYIVCIPTATLEVLTADKTFIALLGAVIGGLGTLVGPLLGGMVVGFLRDYLGKMVQSIHSAIPFLTIQQLQLLPTAILGILYILIVLLLPYGVLGTWYLKGVKIKRKLKLSLMGRKG